MTLRVSEMFYAPQGEGARAGVPSVFVRLQGCSAKHACFTAGVRCDTEFESGAPMEIDELLTRARALTPDCQWVIFTGGEPLDQLTPEVLDRVRAAFARVALETSGARPVSDELSARIDWLAVSPKVAEHVLERHFGHLRRRPWLSPGALDWEVKEAADGNTVNVDELRYVRHAGQALPRPVLTASYYALSPHATGDTLDPVNMAHVLALVAARPEWRVSVQQHKVWRTL